MPLDNRAMCVCAPTYTRTYMRSLSLFFSVAVVAYVALDEVGLMDV